MSGSLVNVSVTNGDKWGTQELDGYATALLHYCNFTLAMVVAVCLVVVYSFVYLFRRPRQSLILQIVIILHAASALYIGIAAFAAFTLAKQPPIVSAFEHNEWRIVGVYVFLTGLFYGLYQTVRVFASPASTVGAAH